MINETMRTPADMRERVVDEIMSTFRTLYPHAGGSVAPAAYAAADRIIALLRTPAAPAPGWSEVRERANMLRAVLREHGFERLRSALVGQHSDAVCYGQWERHKALLRDLLDALDAALRSEAQGEESVLSAARLFVQQARAAGEDRFSDFGVFSAYEGLANAVDAARTTNRSESDE